MIQKTFRDYPGRSFYVTIYLERKLFSFSGKMLERTVRLNDIWCYNIHYVLLTEISYKVNRSRIAPLHTEFYNRICFRKERMG